MLWRDNVETSNWLLPTLRVSVLCPEAIRTTYFDVRVLSGLIHAQENSSIDFFAGVEARIVPQGRGCRQSLARVSIPAKFLHHRCHIEWSRHGNDCFKSSNADLLNPLSSPGSRSDDSALSWIVLALLGLWSSLCNADSFWLH
jgi:hypothetical protein